MKGFLCGTMQFHRFGQFFNLSQQNENEYIIPPILQKHVKEKLRHNVFKYLEDFGQVEVFLMIVFRCENWDLIW